ncbi:MAG TPA: hypothetical protein VHW43_01660 [Puia sp.]|nr:hypothetical protein [Puia sp.]
MKDFHLASLKEKIEPAIFVYNEPNWQMFVRTTGKDAPRAIKAVQKIWKQYNPAFPLEYNFMDDAYNDMDKADQHQAVLFNWFAGIAILISCLGLFGLATYTAQAKVKEIGVRKVLGASVSNITFETVGLRCAPFIPAQPVYFQRSRDDCRHCHTHFAGRDHSYRRSRKIIL